MASRWIVESEPIERKKVYELVADHLVSRISDRRLKPGDALPTERELAEFYRVGRSSIREALRMLESTGLIEPTENGFAVAAYVNPLHQSLHLLMALQEAHLYELFEVRKVFEVEMAGLAAARRREQDLDAMLRALEEMQAGLSTAERYVSADIDFHTAVAEASQNRIASHMLHAIRDVWRRALASIYRIPGSPERSTPQHRRIFQAIRESRPEEAREGMREHLTSVEADIRAHLLSNSAAVPSTEQGVGRHGATDSHIGGEREW